MSVQIKQLAPELIDRANSVSFGGNRGSISAREYIGYTQEIISWKIADSKKQAILDKLYDKWSEILKYEAQHVSVMVAGPSKYNAKKLDKSDHILRLSKEFSEWFESVKAQISNSQKENSKAEQLISLIEFCKKDNPCNPTVHLTQLALYEPETFVRYYEEFYHKYKWKKNSMITKLYVKAKAGEIVPIKREVFFEDDNLTAYTESDRVFIRFITKPKQQLIVALKSKGYWWNSQCKAWSTYLKKLDKAWVSEISSRYGQYI